MTFDDLTTPIYNSNSFENKQSNNNVSKNYPIPKIETNNSKIGYTTIARNYNEDNANRSSKLGITPK